MKRHITIIMVAALLFAACGHRASQQRAEAIDSVENSESTTENSESTEFAADSIGLEREDAMASVKASVAWPTSGNETLLKNIRHYICEELANDPMMEGKPKVKMYEDGKSAVTARVNWQYKELSDMWKQSKEEGFGGDMSYSNFINIFVAENAERYVTYMTNSEGFTGGAHGFASSGGVTFRKSDGKVIGYRTEIRNSGDDIVTEIKDQTLFRDAKSPKLAAVIKEGVRSYFKECMAEVDTDEQLSEQLIEVEDVNRIPLPSNAPLFTKRGLVFAYQQYEIAPYAAGMINFIVAYDKIKPLLTDEAQSLIP